MDIQMPIMDGFETTKKIRENSNNVPIVALSAAVLHSDKTRSKQSGMNDHLSKPIIPKELVRILEKYTSYVYIDTQSNNLILPKINGIDTKKLSDNIDNVDIFYAMLKSFKHNYHDIDIKLSSELPLDILQNEIHALKGVSGNLMMDEIYHYSELMNHAKENIVKDNLQSLIDSVHKILDEISIVLPEENDDYIIKIDIDKEDIVKELKVFITILKKGNFLNQDDQNYYLSIITQFDKNIVTNIKQYLSEFEYDKVVVLLEELLEKTPLFKDE